MQTIQCPRCRHIFLSYASECPECGLRKPRISGVKLAPLAALVVSGFALAATVMMAMKVTEQDGTPPIPKKSAARSR
jgi:uncharacterized protein (DUF983 family)